MTDLKVGTNIKENWKEQKEKLMARFAVLTDTDFIYTEGKMDEFMALIQMKVGRTKEEFAKIIGCPDK